MILIEKTESRYATSRSVNKKPYALYKCTCGNIFEACIYDVNSGNTKSCGCLNNSKHGLYKHKIYKAWINMKSRCLNSNHKLYRLYGERGICICNEWKDNFIEFYNWSISNGYRDSLTIDRIDNNGNYEPSNCRWASKTTQSRNTRRLKSTNTSGYRGVTWRKSRNSWQAQITVSNKHIYIGVFNSALDASKAYDKYVIDNNLEHTLNNSMAKGSNGGFEF